MHPQSPIALTVAVALAAATPGPAQSDGVVVERVAFAMGTSLRIQAQAESRGGAVQSSEVALRAIETAEQRLSTWRDDSELMQMLQAPVGAATPASEELCAELGKAQRWSFVTARAFDPGVGALVEAYDLRGAGRWPSAQRIAEALSRGGVADLDIANGQISRRKDVRLDAGAFGKGAALDAAAHAMKAAGALAATLDFGGQLLLFGAKADVPVDIADPRDRSRSALRVRVGGGSLATSCNSERRLVVDGRPLSHILDPRSGRPAEDLGSVTIWATNAFDADCLSTACFVLGPDAALELVERLDGVEIVVMRCQSGSSALTVRLSSGFKDRVTGVLPELDIQSS